MAHVYVGYRPVLPGQNKNDWNHNVTGEAGVYSNWSLQSSTHLLHGAPLRNHVPGTGNHPHGLLLSQMFTGAHRYAPMELGRFTHGGQSAPYLRHAHWEFHGVSGSEIFHSGDWGYSRYDEREFTFSRWSNHFFRGVPSADSTFDGRGIRYWGDPGVPSGFGRIQPFIFQGVGDDRLEDAGEPLSAKLERGAEDRSYAFQRTQEWHGVTSSQAL